MTTSSSTYLRELHQILEQHFNLTEISNLCFELNVDYESVPGVEKSSRIRELLLALGRNGRLTELVTLAQQQRMHVSWPAVPDDFQLPASLAAGSTAVSVNPSHYYGDMVQGDKIGGDKIAGDKITFEAGATAVYQGLSPESVAALVTELRRQDQPKVWNGRIPYLGLTAFRESDAQFFFGREGLVDELLQRVEQTNFIVIAGPSGSGKSSVARAGLFHALREGRLEQSQTWLLGSMQPKGNPIEQLADAVARLAQSPAPGDYIRQQGATNPLALYQQAKTLLTDDPRQRCVLLVDQFEETFTQTKEEEIRAAFIHMLTTAAQTDPRRVIIVLSLRSDFVSHCARYPELRNMMSQQFQLVGAMAPQDLTKAITLPALEVGAGIDSALVSRIVTDMKEEPGALPLMSFALRDLFEAGKTKKDAPMTLTLSGYLARGGIESALERHANKLFDAFTDKQKALARSIFSKLIEVGEGRLGTRRTATLQELTPAAVGVEAVMVMIGTLAQEGARLITTDRFDIDAKEGLKETAQVTVSLAHEKLIDAWPWLRQLVNENREIIALQNQINTDAQAWVQEEDTGFLYRGGRLLQVEEKLALLQPNLDILSQRFIQAGLEAREAEQQAETDRIKQEEALRQEKANAGRFRRLTRLLGVAAAIAAIATVVALIFLNTARQQSVQADKARSTAEAAATVESEARSVAEVARGEAEVAATTESEARNAAVVARNDAEAAATVESEARSTAVSAQSTAIAAQAQTEQQRQIMSLMAQSQALMNARAPDNQAVARARLMAVAAAQIDQEATGGQNNTLLTPWNYHLTRAISAPYQPIATMEDPTSAIYSMAWNADGSRLASASCEETASNSSSCIQGKITIWQADQNQPGSWQPLTTLIGHSALINDIAWSSDGHRLASAGWDETVIIWQTDENQPDTWQPLTTLTGHTAGVESVAWNHDGSRLASATLDGSIIIWRQTDDNQPDDWQPVTALTNHEYAVNSIAWNADGSRLASASDDDTIIIWQADENQPGKWQALATLTGHTGSVRSVVWNADGNSLASASFNGSIIIWQADESQPDSWKPVTTLTDHTTAVNSMAWNADGSRLASAALDGRIIIWQAGENQLTDQQPVTTLIDNGSWVTDVAWSRDGRWLASADLTGRIIIWDTTERPPVTMLTDHELAVWSLAWNKDGSRLASASSDETVIVWQAEENQPGSWQSLATLTGHKGGVVSVTWNADGSRLASASSDIIIWDTDNWQPLVTLTDPTGSIRSIAWKGDDSRLASGSSDGNIIIWQAEENQPDSWQPLTVLSGHTDDVNSIAWNGDGSRLASAACAERRSGVCRQGEIIIWDTDSWQPLTTLTDHLADVSSVAWNVDGSRLASASWDSTVIIWQADENQPDSWQPLTTLTDHTTQVQSVDWNSDGSLLASASGGSFGGISIIIWDTDSWQPLTILTDHKDEIRHVAWNADGSRLASASVGTIIITEYGDLAARNCEAARRNFSWDEWQRIFPNEPYRVTCPQWPVHPSVPPEERPES